MRSQPTMPMHPGLKFLRAAGVSLSIAFNLVAMRAHADVVVADTTAPSVPGALTATALSPTRINASWAASTDDVGVASYLVYRGGTLIAVVSAPAVSFGDTGLAPSTAYSYTVAACDLAGNCSEQSASAPATTQDGASFTPSYVPGFNLTGNSFATALNVLAVFGSNGATAPTIPGVSDKVEAVWAWNATPPGKWKFHTPLFSAADSAAYALANNYEVLTSLPPGAGYWISAIAPVSLPTQTGTPFNYAKPAFDALPPSFNLLSIGSTLTVSQFNASVGVAPVNFNALWTWDASRTRWYFYSPLLEQPGAPFSNLAYCTANAYLDFAGGTPSVPAFSLQPGAGFWVEKN